MNGNARNCFRLVKHPIIDITPPEFVYFTFNGKKIKAQRGEMISSALFASGIRVFGHHPVDGSPQGIFCANGQCSQCLVIANGVCVKACMTPVSEGMVVTGCEGLPELPPIGGDITFTSTPVVEPEVLIVGAGPAGLSAADTLSGFGISGIIVDDKDRPGGKLTLQTHAFFGSVSACWAGMRGIDIAKILTERVHSKGKFEIWMNTTVVGVFVDKKVGLVRDGTYFLAEPKCFLVAAGAREKTIVFEGCDLPGVYGAGAFQTLLNRDGVIPAKRLLVVGGGNVGLIAAYHALQAGIEVVGIVEALDYIGGYKVHLDKIKRAGVPVWTSHTVIKADGRESVERAYISRVDKNFKPIPGTERSVEVDTILIAVGLIPVNELYLKALNYNIPTWAAGDAKEIAEASAAMFGGKIAAMQIAKHLGKKAQIPQKWIDIEKVLKSRPGKTFHFRHIETNEDFQPVIRCVQEIPCNPCTEVCPLGKIRIEDGSITGLPKVSGKKCMGCGRCVLICPGLAITLLFKKYDPHRKKALLIMPYEMERESVRIGMVVETTDIEGREIGKGKIVGIKTRPEFNKRLLCAVEVDWDDRLKVAGFVIKRPEIKPIKIGAGRGKSHGKQLEREENPIVCRCSRVRKSDIIKEIRRGVRDLNELKATLRTGMGACGGKNCTPVILMLYKEEGINANEITLPTVRPFVTEVPMEVFAGIKKK